MKSNYVGKRNIIPEMSDTGTDTLLVGFDQSNGEDHTVLVVGRKQKNQAVDIINLFDGKEAEELYRKLTTVVKKETTDDGQ